jgi:hypothetical protein
MSTRENMLYRVGFDLTESFSGSLSVAAKLLGISAQRPSDPAAETAATDTITVAHSPQGLASLLGKYNDDPSWEDFPAFLEQYRREIDEMSR